MTERPKYYECDICGGIHPWNFTGDCRDNSNRFTDEALNTKHGGSENYDLATMDERVEADNAKA